MAPNRYAFTGLAGSVHPGTKKTLGFVKLHPTRYDRFWPFTFFWSLNHHWITIKSPLSHQSITIFVGKPPLNQHFCWWYAVLCRPWTFLQPPWWFQDLLCRDLFELWHDVCVSFLFSVSVIWNLVVGIYTKYTNSGQLSKRMENGRWRWLWTKNGQVMHPPEVEELPNPAHVHLAAPVESWKSRGSQKTTTF